MLKYEKINNIRIYSIHVEKLVYMLARLLAYHAGTYLLRAR